MKSIKVRSRYSTNIESEYSINFIRQNLYPLTFLG